MAIPNLTDLQKYNVNVPGQVEGIRQSLYDFQTYASAGQTSLTFFQVPIGQRSKTQADTNMEIAGSLPAPKSFLVTDIEIFVFPGSAVDTFNAADAANPQQADDVYAVMKSGWLDFFIGSKSYLTEAPIGKFPPRQGLKVFSALSTNSATVGEAKTSYASFGGTPYIMDPPILLVPTQNFNISLNWPTAVSLPSGNAGRIGISLSGILYRNSQ